MPAKERHSATVTTCLENLRMSTNPTKVEEISRKSQGKRFITNFMFGAKPTFSRCVQDLYNQLNDFAA